MSEKRASISKAVQEQDSRGKRRSQSSSVCLHQTKQAKTASKLVKEKPREGNETDKKQNDANIESTVNNILKEGKARERANEKAMRSEPSAKKGLRPPKTTPVRKPARFPRKCHKNSKFVADDEEEDDEDETQVNSKGDNGMEESVQQIQEEPERKPEQSVSNDTNKSVAGTSSVDQGLKKQAEPTTEQQCYIKKSAPSKQPIKIPVRKEQVHPPLANTESQLMTTPNVPAQQIQKEPEQKPEQSVSNDTNKSVAGTSSVDQGLKKQATDSTKEKRYYIQIPAPLKQPIKIPVPKKQVHLPLANAESQLMTTPAVPAQPVKPPGFYTQNIRQAPSDIRQESGSSSGSSSAGTAIIPPLQGRKATGEQQNKQTTRKPSGYNKIVHHKPMLIKTEPADRDVSPTNQHNSRIDDGNDTTLVAEPDSPIAVQGGGLQAVVKDERQNQEQEVQIIQVKKKNIDDIDNLLKKDYKYWTVEEFSTWAKSISMEPEAIQWLKQEKCSGKNIDLIVGDKFNNLFEQGLKAGPFQVLKSACAELTKRHTP